MTYVFLLIGLGAGVLSGIFGIGGGIIIVPALLFFAGMPIARATGTSLGALLLPVGALGAYEYWKHGNLDVRASLWIALGLIGGVYIGARVAQLASPLMLKRAFAILLLLVAVRVWMSATPPTDAGEVTGGQERGSAA